MRSKLGGISKLGTEHRALNVIDSRKYYCLVSMDEKRHALLLTGVVESKRLEEEVDMEASRICR